MGVLSFVARALALVVALVVAAGVMHHTSYPADDAASFVSGAAHLPTAVDHIVLGISNPLIAVLTFIESFKTPTGRLATASPQLRVLLSLMAVDRADALAAQPAADPAAWWRHFMGKVTALAVPRADCERTTITDDTGVRVEVVRVGGAPRADDNTHGAVLWLHGGAYLAGSPFTARTWACELSARTGGVDVLVPDYRLAPELQMPRQVDEELVGVYTRARARYSHLAIAGDSAGGGLVMHLFSRLGGVGVADAARRAALEALAPPDALYIMSPYLNMMLNYSSAADVDNTEVILPAKDDLRLDVGRCVLRADPKATVCAAIDASEAHVDALRKRVDDPARWPGSHCCGSRKPPPSLVSVGGDEMLRGDGYEVQAKLRAAGQSDVTLLESPLMMHDYPMFAVLDVPEAVPDAEKVFAFLTKHVGAKK